LGIELGREKSLDQTLTLIVTLAGGGKVKADTDINPWLVGVGVGYKF